MMEIPIHIFTAVLIAMGIAIPISLTYLHRYLYGEKGRQTLLDDIRDVIAFIRYGRRKPCSCPPRESNWGLERTSPENSDEIDMEFLTETKQPGNASTVKEWTPVHVFKCRKCGDTFKYPENRAIKHRIEYNDGTVIKNGISNLEAYRKLNIDTDIGNQKEVKQDD